MKKQVLAKSIYIDALSLVPARKSGVGYATEQTIRALLSSRLIPDDAIVYFVVPLGKGKHLASYLKHNVKIKTIPLPARVFALLLKSNLLPPMDWFLGMGIYIFPNYRNWPLWRSRSLTWFHDIGFIKYPDTVQPRNQKFLAKHSRLWLNRTTKVITITNQVKYELEKEFYLPSNKVSVIYDGVDTKTYYHRGPREIEQVKSRYDINLEKYFLFVGNIEPRKNLIVLLDAYNKLSPELKKEYGLVLIGGDGWLNDKFYARMDEVNKSGGKVIKPSKYVATEDLPALYSGATFLVHPAIYEGFGITPLEAMACETPVLVSDIPAVREVVGDCGVYFDPYSVNSLVAALNGALHNKYPIKKNVEEGKQLAKEFSWSKTARSLNALINEESKEGIEKSPIILRLKFLFLYVDRKIRTLLGDKALLPYKPKHAENITQLQAIVYRDFLKELPSIGQELMLKIYLNLKHLAFIMVKGTVSLRSR